MKNALRFRKNTLEPQENELARLKVVQGPDYGSVYVLRGSPVTIGRGEDCDVMLTDLKTSRKHAAVVLSGNHWDIKDLGSANGILLNGERSVGAPIYSGDSVALGETILEFFSKDSDTRILVAPPRTLNEVQASQKFLVERRKEIRAIGNVKSSAGAAPTPVTPSTSPGGGGNNPVEKIKSWVVKNKKLAAVLGLGLAALLMFDEEPPKKVTKKKKIENARDLATFLPVDDPQIEKQAEVFFKSGFREFREMNYLRAKAEFETVLQMAPSHRLARLYLDKSLKAIEDLVESHLKKGKRSYSAGKLRDAKGQFETVMRLLYRDQNNPNYVEAKDQLEKVLAEIKGDSPVPTLSPPPAQKTGGNS